MGPRCRPRRGFHGGGVGLAGRGAPRANVRLNLDFTRRPMKVELDRGTMATDTGVLDSSGSAPAHVEPCCAASKSPKRTIWHDCAVADQADHQPSAMMASLSVERRRYQNPGYEP